MTTGRPRISPGVRRGLMAAPVLSVIALLVFGLVMAGAQAVGLYGAGSSGRPSLSHIAGVFTDPEFLASAGLTLFVAMASTVVSTVLGVLLALGVHGLARRRSAAHALLQIPLAVPHVVMASTMLLILAPSGLIGRLAFALGLVDGAGQVPALVYDRWGLGIVAAYAAKEVPFLTVVTTAILLRLEPDLDAVARTLGASPWQRLRRVTWPLIAPGVGAAALMVFAFVFAAFETPFLLGRPYPAMLAVLAQQRYVSLDLADRPAAVALALVMTALSGLVVWLYVRVSTSTTGEDRPVVF